MAGVKFTKEAAERIADATRLVERTLGNTVQAKLSENQQQKRWLWAMLTAYDDGTKTFEWEAVEWKTGYTYEANTSFGESDTQGLAVEANSLTTPIGSVVLLQKIPGWQYWVFERTTEVFRFELTEDWECVNASMTDFAANAKRLEWDGDSYEVVGDAFLLEAGANCCWGGMNEGDRGWCAFVDGKYEVVWMEHHAIFIIFEAPSGGPFTSTITDAIVEHWFQGVEPQRGVAPESKVANITIWESDEWATGEKGIAIWDDNNCIYRALPQGGGGGEILVSDWNCCTGGAPAATAIDDESLSSLVFCGGLFVTDGGGGEYIVATNHTITDINDCESEGGLVTDDYFEKLIFGKGLHVTEYTDCQYIIDGGVTVKGETADSDPVDVDNITTLNFENGTVTVDGVNSCQVNVNICQLVDDDDFYLEGDVAPITDTGDTFWIDMPVGITCEENEIVVVTRRFTWDKCGRLIAIAAEDDGSS